MSCLFTKKPKLVEPVEPYDSVQMVTEEQQLATAYEQLQKEYASLNQIFADIVKQMSDAKAKLEYYNKKDKANIPEHILDAEYTTLIKNLNNVSELNNSANRIKNKLDLKKLDLQCEKTRLVKIRADLEEYLKQHNEYMKAKYPDNSRYSS